jgi:hypothetical protein
MVSAAARNDLESLRESFEREIMLRTAGRIHRMAVQMHEDQIIVYGRTATYYAKQLALQAVLDVIGSRDTGRIEWRSRWSSQTGKDKHNTPHD